MIQGSPWLIARLNAALHPVRMQAEMHHLTLLYQLAGGLSCPKGDIGQGVFAAGRVPWYTHTLA